SRCERRAFMASVSNSVARTLPSRSLPSRDRQQPGQHLDLLLVCRVQATSELAEVRDLWPPVSREGRRAEKETGRRAEKETCIFSHREKAKAPFVLSPLRRGR